MFMAIGLGREDAGASALREYERRLARRDAAISAKWGSGRLGRFAKAVTPIPQSTESWARGAEGERTLAATLERRAAADAVFLHDRSVPGRRGNIDHIAVASTGVWVVDAKNYRGRVERRDLGTWRTVDDRLFVAGRDRTKLAAGMTWQADAVRSIVESLGIDAEVDVRRVLCFTDSEWGILAKPFKIDGVIVTYPSALAAAISAGGPLITEHTRAITDELARRLSPACRPARPS